ncbi:MAG: heavy metal translocating P-type ATPase [Armatimonadota bacterium]
METQTLDIPVILPDYYEDCERCMGRLKDALEGLEGVSSAKIGAKGPSIYLTYDANKISLEKIEERVRQLGIEVAERYVHDSLHLEGLDCPDCAAKLEKAVGRMSGVLWSSVNYATSKLSVEYEQKKIDRSAIEDRVRDLGYNVTEIVPFGAEAPAPKPAWLNKRVMTTAVSGIFLVAALIASFLRAPGFVTIPLYAVSIISGGFYAARAGILSLRAFSMDTNLLITLAVIGAIYLHEYGEAAGVLFLFSLGSALEAFTIDRTRRSIRSLIGLSPKEASVIRGGKEEKIRVEDIKVGETVIVRPGERIPLDGVVERGVSSVDESAITGESVPLEKSSGSPVYAGTINQRGSMEVRVTKLVGDDTLSRIIHLVEEAQEQKAPSQQFSEKFGRAYTPVVVGLAAVIALYALMHTDPELFRRSLVLLVVACPCALVISTPVAIVSAIGNAAKNGILIKGGAYLEEMGRVSVVAFDKTGTLTTGRLEVTDIIVLDSNRNEVLKIAASIESRSEHPLAESILRKASDEKIELYDLAFFEALPGIGARGVMDSQLCHIGNQRLLEQLGIPVPEPSIVEKLRGEGKTLMFVVSESKVIGIIAAADAVRESSRDSIAALKRAGVDKTVMLTGDNELTAHAVAERLGIDNIEAELLPEEKVGQIKKLVARYGKVAMIGDGINDAPALAAATVGIAMGGAGSHAALETADLALMADDLSKLPYGIRLSRSSLRVIKQNIGFSVFVVVGLVALTLAGSLSLTLGIIGHEGSALLVIANGMRLLRLRAQ